MPEDTQIQQDGNRDRANKIGAKLIIGGGKIGVLALALLNGSPIAAVEIGAAAELMGIMGELPQERLAYFLHRTGDLLRGLPVERKEQFQKNVQTSEGMQVFEDTVRRAVQTSDLKRIEALATFLKNGLSSEELKSHQVQWLSRILDELDSVELIILKAYTEACLDDEGFHERHAEILSEDDLGPKESDYESDLPLGEDSTPQECAAYREDARRLEIAFGIAKEKHAIHNSRMHHLVNLGLLGVEPRSRRAIVGITPLGAALLKITDAIPDDIFGQAEPVSSVQAIERMEKEAAAREVVLIRGLSHNRRR